MNDWNPEEDPNAPMALQRYSNPVPPSSIPKLLMITTRLQRARECMENEEPHVVAQTEALLRVFHCAVREMQLVPASHRTPLSDAVVELADVLMEGWQTHEARD